jgi:hypothetical protein
VEERPIGRSSVAAVEEDGDAEVVTAISPELLMRGDVRITAGKMLRSDEMIADEREVAAGILRANPALGNPHAVRCGWCNEMRMLFRDESDGPFKVIPHGWLCEPCDVSASSQEIRF